MSEALGAFIRDWQPPQHDKSFLERYLVMDKKIEDSNELIPTKGNQNYIEELNIHFARLDSQVANWEKPFVNLVFGNVQSGKTSHLRANICWARDNKFDLLILLTGSNTDLGDQTVDTLETKLPNATIKLIKSPTEGSLSEEKMQEIRHAVSARISDKNAPVPLISLIKSPKRLDAVKLIIQHISNSSLPDIKVLILDDEADQVSPDADASKRTEIEDRLEETRSNLRISVHTRINEIRDAIRGIHIYLAYTATPQALFLGDLNSTMQPRFCSIVPPGKAYVGISDFVIKQNQDRNTFIVIPSDTTTVNEEQNQIALEYTFVTFIYLMWLHKNYPEIFHGARVSNDLHCSCSSLQFLIHPSGKSDYHKEYADAVNILRKDLKRSMAEPGRDREYFSDNLFLPIVSKVAEQLPMHKDFLLNSDNLKSAWEYFFQVLDDSHALQAKLVNHKERQRQQSESSSRRVSLVPVTEDDWNVPGRDGWILVGGNILGRGLAIPHLVVTLFLRNPKHPNFDTAVQQMRFCGYRRNYLDLISIFAPPDIIEDYQTAVEIDAPFRNRALRWHRESRDLLKNPPIMRFIAPAGSRYRPTRNAVISTRVSSNTTSSKSGFFSLGIIANPHYFKSNLNLVIDLTSKLHEVDRRKIGGNTVVYYSLDKESRSVLFNKLKIHTQDSRDAFALNELMGYSEDEKGLENVDHLFAIDESTIKLNSSDSATDLFIGNPVDTFGFRTLNQAIGPGDWKKDEVSSALRHAAAKSIVGDSERNVHLEHPEAVVIHARTFNLRNPIDESTVGLGLSLIGWLPSDESDFQVYSNEEAIYV